MRGFFGSVKNSWPLIGIFLVNRDPLRIFFTINRPICVQDTRKKWKGRNSLRAQITLVGSLEETVGNQNPKKKKKKKIVGGHSSHCDNLT